jgi:peptide/nickel transport system substrate-binding protein
VVIQIPSRPPHLNPLLDNATVWTNRIAMHNIFETLVTRDANLGVVPHLAAKSEVGPGGRRYRFYLRPGIRFHDGRMLSSGDVIFTLRRVLGQRAPHGLLRAQLADIEGFDELSPSTVELRLKRANGLILTALAEMPILPAHLYQGEGPQQSRQDDMPIGTGPYKVVPGHGAANIRLEPFASYWGPRTSSGPVVFRVIGDPVRALASLRNGEVDILPELHPVYFPKEIDRSRMRSKFSLHRLQPFRMRVLLFNMRRRVLRDRRTRIAIDHLIDRRRMIQRQRNELGQVWSGPLWPLSSWSDPSIRPREYSRERAGQLLDAVGWIQQKRGKWRERDGHPVVLQLLHARETPLEEVRQIKSDLESAGIRIELKVGDYDFIRGQLRRGLFHLALAGLALPPEGDPGVLFHSEGEMNLTGFRSAAVDAIVEVMRRGRQPADVTLGARRLHLALFENPPLLVLYAPVELCLVNKRLEGFDGRGQWPLLSRLRSRSR